MKQSSKRIIAIVLVFMIFLHFTFISIYCLPYNYINPKVRLLSSMYVYPIFNQNWCLFVPPPTSQHRIFVRYQTKVGYSNWEDILEKQIIKHKASPLVGNEAVYLLLSNSVIYEFKPLMRSENTVYNQSPNNIEFKVLYFEVSKYLKLNYNLPEMTNYEMLLVSTDKTFNNAYYIKSLRIN